MIGRSDRVTTMVKYHDLQARKTLGLQNLRTEVRTLVKFLERTFTSLRKHWATYLYPEMRGEELIERVVGDLMFDGVPARVAYRAARRIDEETDISVGAVADLKGDQLVLERIHENILEARDSYGDIEMLERRVEWSGEWNWYLVVEQLRKKVRKETMGSENGPPARVDQLQRMVDMGSPLETEEALRARDAGLETQAVLGRRIGAGKEAGAWPERDEQTKLWDDAVWALHLSMASGKKGPSTKAAYPVGNQRQECRDEEILQN